MLGFTGQNPNRSIAGHTASWPTEAPVDLLNKTLPIGLTPPKGKVPEISHIGTYSEKQNP